MKIIIVDDEKLVLEDLITKVKKVLPSATIKGFQNSELALAAVQEGFIADVAFLDIEMYGINGIELALQFKQLIPAINLIFVTGFSEYATEAFSLYASGYITKPARIERIKAELNNLRNPVLLSESRIQIRTFGNFDILVEDRPIKFSRSRTKEILAYLVDLRGTGATMAELAAVLWGDRKYDRSLQKQLQVHISDLMSTLRSVGAEMIIIKSRNYLSVDISQFDCDAYRLLEGDVTALNAFSGKYMSNYSWSELTLSFLERKQKLERG